MQLLDDLKSVLLVSDDDDRPLFDAGELEQVLMAARTLDKRVVEQDLQQLPCSSYSGNPFTFHDNGQVTIVLRDLLEDQTEYGFSPILYLHPHGFKVYVDGVVVPVGDPAAWAYDAMLMALTFTDAQSTSAIVAVRGWLVDMRAAKYDAYDRYISKLGMLGNVRGQEYDQQMKRALAAQSALYGGVQLRSGAGASGLLRGRP